MDYENAIEMIGVTKNYEGFTLENLNLKVPNGSIVGLVGTNGAGKSTTIKLIMNAVASDKGRIIVLGKDNTDKDFDRLKEEIGVVLDEAYFPESLTAKNVNSIMKRTYQKWDEKLYFDYMADFRIDQKKTFKDYSRGMKMKLAIAVALAHKPKLLILDEATSGLDPIIRNEILDIFNDFTRNEDNSILLSSHIVSDLEKICDYIAFLQEGKLVFCEEKDRILEKYAVVKVSDKDYENIPSDAIMGRSKSKYDVEVLVEKSKLSNAFSLEHTTLEDIILLFGKE